MLKWNIVIGMKPLYVASCWSATQLNKALLTVVILSLIDASKSYLSLIKWNLKWNVNSSIKWVPYFRTWRILLSQKRHTNSSLQLRLKMWPSSVLTRWKSFCIEKDVRSIKKFLQVFMNFLQDGRRARNVAELALWAVAPTVNTKWDGSRLNIIYTTLSKKIQKIKIKKSDKSTYDKKSKLFRPNGEY
jgi:hypothetical protein